MIFRMSVRKKKKRITKVLFSIRAQLTTYFYRARSTYTEIYVYSVVLLLSYWTTVADAVTAKWTRLYAKGKIYEYNRF